MRLSGCEMAKGSDKKPEYTTFRLFVEDGENLSELADKRGLSVAKLYRQMFAEIVRRELIEEAKKRLKDLESRKPN